MMMTQSCHSGNYGFFTRLNPRASAAAQYDRSARYANRYYEQPSFEPRSEHLPRHGARTMMQGQPSDNGPSGHVRRRIPVACIRCRQRKIKCSGDPGDDSGCAACKQASGVKNAHSTVKAEKIDCKFIRVGSHALPESCVDIMESKSGVVTTPTRTVTSYGSDVTSAACDPDVCQIQHPPALQMLPTRPACPEYDSYNTPPGEVYTYLPAMVPPRSISSIDGAENFRLRTNGSFSVPVTSTSPYHETGAASSFGSLHASGPFTSKSTMRLPSVTADAFSALDMGSLHSSLPTQTVHERRLPAPCSQSYQQTACTTSEVAQIRPLASFMESQAQPHVHGIHTRTSIPWNFDDANGAQLSYRRGSVACLSGVQPPHRLQSSSSESSLPSLTAEPILGYQFSAASDSPKTSPKSGPALSASFSGASSTATPSVMPLGANLRYSTSSLVHGSRASSGTEEQSRPVLSRGATSSLYSYSSAIDAPDRSNTDSRVMLAASSSECQNTVTSQQKYPYLSTPLA